MTRRIEQLGAEPAPKYNGFMTFPKVEPKGNGNGKEQAEADNRVCGWCNNRGRERCNAECQTEGKYRYLEPVTLESYETGTELPAFKEVVDMTPSCRLAILYLMAYYADYRDRRE